jgi:hypothetical protein
MAVPFGVSFLDGEKRVKAFLCCDVVILSTH